MTAHHPYQPDRGHLVYLAFDPQAGTEQAGRRPALILSPRRFNVAVGLAAVCPVTNQIKGGAFEVPLPPGGRITGVVQSDQFRTLDWLARRADFIVEAPAAVVDETLARIQAILQL